MWRAFGQLGHWSEWHALAPNMRMAIEMARPKIATYGHAFIENPAGNLTWFAARPVGFTKRDYVLHPYKPLQTDWGVEEP